MTIAIYARSTKDNNSTYIEQIYHFLKSENVDVIIFKPFYEYLQTNFAFNLEIETYSNSEELISKAFYLICL